MACTKCRKSPCGCKKNNGSSLSSSDQATISDIQDQLNALTDAAQFLLNGHPILIVENADDIAQFDLSTGLGINYWAGWALCNGTQQYSAKLKKFIPVPDFTDRFIVMAGGEYAVDDTGGADTVSLTAAQNGKHNHVLTDLGHFHVATQVAHTHGIDEHGGHTHGFVSQPVVVDTFNAVEPNPGHNHGYGASATTFYHAVPPGDTHTSQAWDGSNIQGTTDTAITIPVDIPPFTVSGTTDQVATGLSIIVADPAITVNPEETGITLADSGDGDAHENRPPFFASFYVMRVG